MKKLIVMLILLLLGAMNLAPTIAHAVDDICAVGFAPGKTVSVEIYDATAAATILADTATGVTEHAATYSSTYCYEGAIVPTDCHRLIISWHDNSAPVRAGNDAKVWNCTSASDPWATALPGAYGAGTAGKILSNYPAIVLPVMQGSVYTAFAVQNKELQILWKSTPTIPFQVSGDYSAWTAKFAVKKDVLDTAYIISPIDTSALVYDSVKKTTSGTVTLTSAQTAVAGKYWAEIEFYNGAQRLPAVMFKFTVLTGVID